MEPFGYHGNILFEFQEDIQGVPHQIGIQLFPMENQ
jgi:hypothetical protein